MKSKHQERVEEFMMLAGQEIPPYPQLPSLQVRELRAKLILEEALETIEALGFDVCSDTNVARVTMKTCWLAPNHNEDLVEIIDGLCDISVVNTGTASAIGVPLEPFLEEVDANNLAKFGPGHSIREDGKLVKPPGHQPPNIQGILDSLTTC